MSRDSNARKSQQLGMPFGTANARLRKIILFSLVQELGRDDCYRCGEKIVEIENFTIEHKKAWLNNDVELFWSLANIAFSHMACNIGARRPYRTEVCFKCKVNPPRYNGKGYAKECRDCNTEYARASRERTGTN